MAKALPFHGGRDFGFGRPLEHEHTKAPPPECGGDEDCSKSEVRIPAERTHQDDEVENEQQRATHETVGISSA